MGRKHHVVTLVPWRPDGTKQRVFNWDVTLPHLEGLGYPVYTGAPLTPEWSRAEAVNAAAAAAGDWDVALVGDADTIPDPGSIRRAVSWVRDTRGGVRPHMDRWDLTHSATLRVAQGTDPRTLAARDHRAEPGGGLMVIHRAGFDAIGGYDETFRGWGYEDTAANLALLRHAAFDRLPGECWHLWHGESGWRGASEASVAKHKQLLAEHRREVMAFMANKGWSTPAERML